GLGDPERVGEFRPIAFAVERLEGALDVILAKEQVQVLGVAPDPGVRLQRVVAADHGLEALLLQDRQRAPVGIALFFLLRRHLANLGTAESGGKRVGQESGLAPGGFRRPSRLAAGAVVGAAAALDDARNRRPARLARLAGAVVDEEEVVAALF